MTIDWLIRIRIVKLILQPPVQGHFSARCVRVRDVMACFGDGWRFPKYGLVLELFILPVAKVMAHNILIVLSTVSIRPSTFTLQAHNPVHFIFLVLTSQRVLLIPWLVP